MVKSLFSRSAIAYRSLAGAVLLCLGLLIWDIQNPQTLQPVRSLLHQITSPASSLGAFFNQNTTQIGANLKSRQELYRENLSLKAELAAANLYLQQNAQQASELAQLSGIFTRPLSLPGSVQLAGVVGIDNNPLRHIFVINKGARDGVYELLSKETGLPVSVAEDPLTCVTRGGGKALELIHDKAYSSIFTGQ